MKIKTVGQRHSAEDTPAGRLARATRLQRQADSLNPFPRPRGFVFKARTWDDYAAWRARQENPRLW
jgi:hypothetical protein